MDCFGVLSVEASCDTIAETCGSTVALGNLRKNKPRRFDRPEQAAGNKGRAIHHRAPVAWERPLKQII